MKQALWNNDLHAHAMRIKTPRMIPLSLQLEYNRDRKRLAADKLKDLSDEEKKPLNDQVVVDKTRVETEKAASDKPKRKL